MLKKVILSILLAVFITSCGGGNHVSKWTNSMTGRVYSCINSSNASFVAFMGEFLILGELLGQYDSYSELLICDYVDDALDRKLISCSSNSARYKIDLVGDGEALYYDVEYAGSSIYLRAFYEYKKEDGTIGREVVDLESNTVYEYDSYRTQSNKTNLKSLSKMSDDQIKKWKEDCLKDIPEFLHNRAKSNDEYYEGEGEGAVDEYGTYDGPYIDTQQSKNKYKEAEDILTSEVYAIELLPQFMVGYLRNILQGIKEQENNIEILSCRKVVPHYSSDLYHFYTNYRDLYLHNTIVTYVVTIKTKEKKISYIDFDYQGNYMGRRHSLDGWGLLGVYQYE